MVHELKCLPPYFAAVLDGTKRFEVRRDDRPFAVDDWLLLREWDREREYTGRVWPGRIIYVLRGFQGVRPDYCVLGIAPSALAPGEVGAFAACEAREPTLRADDMVAAQPLAARISQEEARRRVAVKRAQRVAAMQASAFALEPGRHRFRTAEGEVVAHVECDAEGQRWLIPPTGPVRPLEAADMVLYVGNANEEG